MTYREVQPGPAIRPFVECFWFLELEASDAPAVQRVVPDGSPELIFHLGSPFEWFHNGAWRVQPRCFLAGQITGPLLLRPTGPARIAGIRFLPHGAARVLRIPMHHATGRIVPLADLAPALLRDFERACETGDTAALDTSLRPIRAVDALVHEAVCRIVSARGAWDVSHLARDLGITTRHLERLFRDEVGLSPKLFCRIQRFQHIFQVIEGRRPDWVQAALACGYHDQAHLIRDFRDFAGEPPSLLLAEGDLARHFLRDPRPAIGS